MKVSFTAARRINLGIRVIAAIIAAVPVPFVVFVLLILARGGDWTSPSPAFLVVFTASSFVYFPDTRCDRSLYMLRALPHRRLIVLQHVTSNQSLEPTAGRCEVHI